MRCIPILSINVIFVTELLGGNERLGSVHTELSAIAMQKMTLSSIEKIFIANAQCEQALTRAKSGETKFLTHTSVVRSKLFEPTLCQK